MSLSGGGRTEKRAGTSTRFLSPRYRQQSPSASQHFLITACTGASKSSTLTYGTLPRHTCINMATVLLRFSLICIAHSCRRRVLWLFCCLFLWYGRGRCACGCVAGPSVAVPQLQAYCLPSILGVLLATQAIASIVVDELRCDAGYGTCGSCARVCGMHTCVDGTCVNTSIFLGLLPLVALAASHDRSTYIDRRCTSRLDVKQTHSDTDVRPYEQDVCADVVHVMAHQGVHDPKSDHHNQLAQRALDNVTVNSTLIFLARLHQHNRATCNRSRRYRRQS